MPDTGAQLLLKLKISYLSESSVNVFWYTLSQCPVSLEHYCTLADYFLGAIHMGTLLCVNAPPASLCGQRICILCISMTMTASLHHSTCSLRPLLLWRLVTTKTTMEDYMLVFMPHKILSLLGLQGQNIMLLCHYIEQKRIMDNLLAIFVFFLLCLVSPSTVCLYTVCKLYAHAPSLLLRFWGISRATYRPGIWTTEHWVVYNGSIWTQIFLKQCQG